MLSKLSLNAVTATDLADDNFAGVRKSVSYRLSSAASKQTAYLSEAEMMEAAAAKGGDGNVQRTARVSISGKGASRSRQSVNLDKLEE